MERSRKSRPTGGGTDRAPRDAQLKSFLEKFSLLTDNVAGIGPSRINQLASFGIESAADIERDAILAVPGLGLQLADRLCQWRDALKTRFRFNPAAPVRTADMRRLARDLPKPLGQMRRECQRSTHQAQILERRLVSVTQRLVARDAATGAAVRAAAAVEANSRAGRLLPVLSA